MPTAGPLVRLGLAAVLVLGAAACSDDGDGSGDAAPTTTTTATTTTTTPTEAPLAPLDDQTPPAGANGIRVGPDGLLWIADLEGGQIVAVDPSTGELVARLGADAGVTTPDDLAFDADGRLWWTEFPGGAVGRIDDPADPAATSEVVTEVGSGANPIAIDDQGRIFVGRTIEGAGVYELDPASGEAREVTADPGLINGFDVGADGRIYAPVSDRGEVVAIDPTTGEVEVVDTGHALPVSVRWSPDGRLAVLAGAPATVTLTDLAGQSETWTALTPVGDNMAFGPDGTLYVTGFDQPTVTAFAPDGAATELPLGAAEG